MKIEIYEKKKIDAFCWVCKNKKSYDISAKIVTFNSTQDKYLCWSCYKAMLSSLLRWKKRGDVDKKRIINVGE